MVRVSTADARTPANPRNPAAGLPLSRGSAADILESSGGSLVSHDIRIVDFRVVVDHREGAPYTFTGLRSDSDDGYRKLVVPLITKQLETGDYTIEGYERQLAIERKSPEDLVSTLACRREQFEAEHKRMQEIAAAGGYAAVVIESSISDLIEQMPLWSRMNPKTIHRTSLAWGVRYGVPWLWMDGRRFAEVTVFRLMEKWRDEHLKKQAAAMTLFD